MKGKDCMTATYTYDELVKAYDSFLAPAIKIYVNNETEDVIKAQEAAIDSVQITLSAGQAAGLSFQIINAYDMEKHSIKQTIKDSFSVGKVVKVAIGYGSNLTTVFKGYITQYSTSYQDIPIVSVTAVDLRKLLRENKRQNESYTEQKYSEIFSAIMGNYESLYDDLHVDEDSNWKKETLTQKGTDYQFISEVLCSKANRDFYMFGGDVYFKEPADSSKPKESFLELEWGKNLLSFQKGNNYCNKKIAVSSSQTDATVLTESETVKTNDNTPSLTSEPIVEEWQMSSGMDKQGLQNCLNKKVAEKKKKNETARGSLLGLPEIVPGRYIKIGGVDSADGGTYYIQEVSHSFGSDGFSTSFSVGYPDDRWVSDGQAQTSDNDCKGIMRAVVQENWNEEEPGKVLVQFLSGEEGTNSSKWLPVIQPYCGDGYGSYFLPEVGTEVMVGSQMGDINSLVVLGSTWNEDKQIPTETAVEKNTIKRIRTKKNHEILFDDDEEETGQIKIATGEGLKLILKEKEKTISILDTEGKNGIVIDGKNGTVEIKAEKKITLSSGDKKMLVADGDGKKLTIDADKLEETASQSFQLKAQQMKVQGDMTELKGNQTMKINGGTMTEIKGTMVKIN